MSYQYYQPKKKAVNRSDGSTKFGFLQTLHNIKQSPSVLAAAKQGRMGRSAIVRRHRPDYYLVLFMALLWLIGLIVMFAISPQIINVSNSARGNDASQHYYFTKQLISVAVAIGAFVLMRRIPVDFWKKYLMWFLLIGFGVSVVLFILSQVSPETVCSLGACRWIRVGGFSVQAAEVLKLCLLMFFAFFWSHINKDNSLNNAKPLAWSVAIITAAAFVTMVWQKDLGTGLALLIFLILMLWLAGIKKSYMIAAIFSVVTFGLLAIVAQPYRMVRVKTFFLGDNAPMTSSNRHSIEARIALGSGGLFGLGVGNSIQSTGYLPEAINDSIFAIVGEIFGFFGVLVVLALFLALLWRLLRGAVYSHNLFGQLVFVGVFGWVFAHLFLNVASMIGLMPMTGITLPFLSYGGTSMVFVAAALGLAFQMSSYTAHVPYYQLNKPVKKGVMRG